MPRPPLPRMRALTLSALPRPALHFAAHPAYSTNDGPGPQDRPSARMMRGPTWKDVAGSVAVILALSPPMFATRTGAQEWQRQPPASADGCSLRLERGEKTTCMRCRAGFKMKVAAKAGVPLLSQPPIRRGTDLPSWSRLRFGLSAAYPAGNTMFRIKWARVSLSRLSGGEPVAAAVQALPLSAAYPAGNKLPFVRPLQCLSAAYPAGNNTAR